MNKPHIPAIHEVIPTPGRQQDQLKLVMIQANPTVGALTANKDFILEQRRLHADADLLVFSECFLTGYPLQDLVNLPHFIAADTRSINELQTAIRDEAGPAVLLGAPTPGADKPYNSAILIRADGTLAVTHKQELPNDGVFDEKRNFAQGAGKAMPLRLNETWSLGVMVCEDGWHKKVADDLAGEGADLLISLNGSPAKLGKQEERLAHARRRVAETGLPFVYVNQFGGQDELVFDGSSFVLNANGELLTRLAFMAGDSAALKVTRDERGHAHIERPHTFPLIVPNASEPQLYYCGGMLGTRDYANKNHRELIHLGVSGGKDSAAALAMACDAVGPARVIGYRLPSDFTSNESMELAEEIIRRCGCRMETVDISGAVRASLASVAHLPARNPEAASLMRENMLARERMKVLRAAVNLMGGMLLGISNMSEAAVGYTTIDGDMAADFNPLKSLLATKVWEAMRWRNAHVPAGSLCAVESPIPEAIIARAPSAENKTGQTDEASLGAYTVLDPLLRGMIWSRLDPQTARRQVEHDLDVTILPTYAAKIEGQLYGSEFKRWQAPMGPQLVENSFGRARRMPATNHYRFEERPAYEQAQRQPRIATLG